MNIVPTVGVVVFNKEKKVLLVRHTKAAGNLTGMYGLPAGRLEEEESEKHAAARELLEEAGIKAKEEDLIEFPNEVPVAKIKRKDGSVTRFSIKPYICKSYTGELKNSEEGVPEWVDIMDISEYVLLENVETIINNAIKYLWLDNDFNK
ncbi:NUDIX hydrolase [Patescibacteria group bacterium]|nr:NUDIX hydrolase [Patescibacteria group bacterium]